MEAIEQAVPQPKKSWAKPELDVLDIRDTEYWEFRTSKDGFWQENFVNES